MFSNCRYLSTVHDLELFKRAAKLSWKIGQTEPLVKQIDPLDTTPELDGRFDELSDEQLTELIKSRLETLYVYEQSPLAPVDIEFFAQGTTPHQHAEWYLFPKEEW
jgi:hypothetical protein